MMLDEQGRDALELHAPFWAVFPSITVHSDAIRNDFVAVMNKLHLEKVQNRSQTMAWREGLEFHLLNLSSFFDVKPEEIIDGWKTNIQKAKDNDLKGQADKCLFDTVANYFDEMKIHSMQSDALGIKWTDHLTEIPTDRQARFKTYGFPPP
ncbi:MAG: hypothetical protein ACREJN_01065 [Nitrospiraceae bacterium]